MTETKKQKILATKKTIKKRNSKTNGFNIFVSGYQLVCPICQNKNFFTKKSMLRGGRWASFFDTEWLFDNAALIAVCEKCSHISWFKDSKRIKIENQKELNE